MTEKTVCCNADPVWELWYCDKNPEALIPEPQEHGNEIDGTITCEDDYCHPEISELDFIPTTEYIKTHECHSRCPKCGSLTRD